MFSPLHCISSLASPSFNFQIDSLHLCLTFRSNGDSLSSCFHDGEWITFHDVQKVFVFIMRDVKFHVTHEQTHILPSPSL
jgi:hypothetical protein